MPLSDEHWRRFGPLAAGALFGAAWWIWVDAVVCNSSTVPFLHYVPGTASPAALRPRNRTPLPRYVPGTAPPCRATSQVPPPPAALRPRYCLPLLRNVTASNSTFPFPTSPSFPRSSFGPPPSATMGFVTGIFATVAVMFAAVHRDELGDASKVSSLYPYRLVTGIFATVAAMMFNAVHRDELHDYSPYDDGAGCRSPPTPPCPGPLASCAPPHPAAHSAALSAPCSLSHSSPPLLVLSFPGPAPLTHAPSSSPPSQATLAPIWHHTTSANRSPPSPSPTALPLRFPRPSRSRTWLFLAYVIAFASLAGAAGMLIKDASPPSTSSWPGAAGVFQCAFIIARCAPSSSPGVRLHHRQVCAFIIARCAPSSSPGVRLHHRQVCAFIIARCAPSSSPGVRLHHRQVCAFIIARCAPSSSPGVPSSLPGVRLHHRQVCAFIIARCAPSSSPGVRLHHRQVCAFIIARCAPSSSPGVRLHHRQVCAFIIARCAFIIARCAPSSSPGAPSSSPGAPSSSPGAPSSSPGAHAVICLSASPGACVCAARCVCAASSPLLSYRPLSRPSIPVALSLSAPFSSPSLSPLSSRRALSIRALPVASLPIALSLSPPFPSPSLSPLPSHRALSLRALLVALSLAPLISSRSLYPRPSRRLPSHRPLSLPSLPVALSLPPPFPSRSLSLRSLPVALSLAPPFPSCSLSLRALPVALSPVAFSPIALALFFALSRRYIYACLPAKCSFASRAIVTVPVTVGTTKRSRVVAIALLSTRAIAPPFPSPRYCHQPFLSISVPLFHPVSSPSRTPLPSRLLVVLPSPFFALGVSAPLPSFFLSPHP
ncbi:unnamed protein product [Closterium sp. NIES-64]|nr:unnamed protein product [Closterium sp. NIES-64]